MSAALSGRAAPIGRIGSAIDEGLLHHAIDPLGGGRRIQREILGDGAHRHALTLRQGLHHPPLVDGRVLGGQPARHVAIGSRKKMRERVVEGTLRHVSGGS